MGTDEFESPDVQVAWGMTDKQIAAHEAGHALLAHVLGESIREVAMRVDDEHEVNGASVRLHSAVRHQSTALGGMYGEMQAGFPLYSGKAGHDASLAAQLPKDEYSPRSLLAKYEDVFRDLWSWFEEARTGQRTLSGDDVHAFLTSRGVAFDSARTS
jgi:hypothetical protein